MIYLDYCATTPISERSLNVFIKASKNFYGNSNSLHDEGEKARLLLEKSRKTIANFINGEENGVFFTSGGTESNQILIETLLNGKKGHIITTGIEHPSVKNTFLKMKEMGFSLTFLDVNRYGEVEIDALEKALQNDTLLVSIGHGNSEIGTIQPLKQIGRLLKDKGILFHSDCVQTFGKVKIDVKELNLDSLSISSHKIYGPKGVGAGYVCPSIKWKGLYRNVSHENGFRSGTVNVPGVAAFAEATLERSEQYIDEQEQLNVLAKKLVDSLRATFDFIHLVGHPTNRLPNHVALRVSGVEGQYMLLELNKANIAISTSSACKSNEKNSTTMLQLGYSKDEAREAFRISLGKYTTEKQIEKTIQSIKNIIYQCIGGKQS